MVSLQNYSMRSEPLQPIRQAPSYDMVPPKSRKQQRTHDDAYPDGLAITYEMHDQQPVYRPNPAKEAMGWDQNSVPIPRNKQNGNFLSAYDAENDKSNRADSVFDAYVDMYADYSDNGEDEDLGEDALEDLNIPVPQTAPLRTPNSRVSEVEEDLDSYDHSQAREPWDERGKTGLYGGGGRGANDRETGWVREYAFSPPQASNTGFEEDLSLDDEDVGPKDRKGSRGTNGRRSDDGRRRSSAETASSSYGPVTPVSTSFNAASINPKYADSGYRSAGSPPQSTTSARHAHSHSNASSFNGAHRSSSPPPPVPAPTRPTRVSPPPQPVHTIDPSLVKKRANDAAHPIPSAPIPVGSKLPPSIPSVQPVMTADRPRRKSGFSKWGGRGKKTPAISAPILPEGFVESLGMETFALYPGCKPPSHAILSPVIRSPSPAAAQPRAAPAPAGRAASPPSARKAAPRPHNVGSALRPHKAPPASLALPQSDRSSSPALATPVRLPLDALRDDTDAVSEGYPEDAFRRLSKDSDGSYAPNGSQSTKTTHRKYFDGIRQEHARHEEVQANRGVVPANAPVIPPVPSTRHQDSPSSYNNPAPAFQSPQASVRSGGSSTVGGGFRDPWSGGAGASPSIRSSIHSQRTTGRRPSYAPTAGDRVSMASTAHEHDFRKMSHVSARSRLSHDERDSPRAPSSQQQHPDLPTIVAPPGHGSGSGFSSPYAASSRDDRNGSVSSAYSEVSEAPPTNDFHPRAHPGFAPQTAVTHLRKNSLAGLSFGGPSASSDGHGSSTSGSTAPYVAVAPLNLSRRPSHIYGQNKFGGDVVWGGTGIGGPKDVASPIMEAKSPVIDAPTIGTTGFRNPFG
ncbi:hypothetical protein JCM10207_001088 [Rhodosporidiobolus poonsookiae]